MNEGRDYQRRFTTRIGLVLAFTLLAVGTAGADEGSEVLLLDGFELGDVSSWSDISGGATPATPAAFRITDLDLLDPHLFALVLEIACVDVTSTLNLEIADSISQDEDLDGCLDLSGMLLFRPLEQTLLGQTVDLRSGHCSAVPSTCRVDTGQPAERLSLDNLAAGTCLEALAGTTSGDSPVPQIAAPCFVTDARDTSIELEPGLAVPLLDVQIAGEWNGDPTGPIQSGLLRGFLAESVADNLTRPGDTVPLSAYLRGGAGTCAVGDDRDVHPEGGSGWWLYASFEAGEVVWSGL